MIKALLLLFAVGPAVAIAQRDRLDGSIWLRDIFHCLEHRDCTAKPIRGWTITIGDDVEFSGSVDWASGTLIATKGKEKQYFWFYVGEGVDPKNGQSVSETRVKMLDSLDENPDETPEMRDGLWSDDHGVLWLPGKDGIGMCVDNPLSGIAMWGLQSSKEDCANRKGWKDENGNPLPAVILKPWKDTPKECRP